MVAGRWECSRSGNKSQGQKSNLPTRRGRGGGRGGVPVSWSQTGSRERGRGAGIVARTAEAAAGNGLQTLRIRSVLAWEARGRSRRRGVCVGSGPRAEGGPTPSVSVLGLPNSDRNPPGSSNSRHDSKSWDTRCLTARRHPGRVPPRPLASSVLIPSVCLYSVSQAGPCHWI